MTGNSRQDAPALAQLSAYLTQPAVGCELCEVPGGELLWEDDFCRVVSVKDGDYPGFCRVILRQHVREMTDLPGDEQMRLMRVVFATEAALRVVYQPDKVNLASFGNVVPHVHWHVIPRWHDDRHFPQPIWGTPQRVASAARPLVSNRRVAEEISARVTA
ncbi:MAG: HIT family protein [Betaproteobacteria bacterium]|jgi:diadenosine tetraphosphate (Ap4A) HIT family hydrolase|nr:HIT family protein [Betaproteobacteria bacterium]